MADALRVQARKLEHLARAFESVPSPAEVQRITELVAGLERTLGYSAEGDVIDRLAHALGVVQQVVARVDRIEIRVGQLPDVR